MILLAFSACKATRQGSTPDAYITDDGQIWAYGDIVIGETALTGVDSGIMLENLTPDKDMAIALNRASMRFELYRAMTNAMGESDSQSEVIFADLHPENSGKVLAYAYTPKFEGSGNKVEIKFVLVKAAPTYKVKVAGEEGVPAMEIPIGTATFNDQKVRASVQLRAGLKIARILNGPKRGHWVVYESEKAFSGKLDDLEDLCRRATRYPGSIQGDVASSIMGRCQPKPMELDFCNGDPSSGSCVPPAPVASDDPFANVGEISATDLSPIRAINEKRRQYQFSGSAAPDDQVDVTFVAKNISATLADNARKCRDLFEAKAWTVGQRINPACKLTPAPSPEPKNGKLACRVSLEFVFPQSYLEKNCYLTGHFAGETDSAETVQILTQ